MARIRTIKPELATSLTVSSWSLLAQALWPRLFCHVDDDGRCVLEPRLLAAAIAPLVDECTPASMVDVVKEWESTGSVQVYEVDGRTYLQVSEWDDHQYIKHKKDSAFPGPEQADSDVGPALPPDDPRTTPASLPLGSVEQGTGNREGNRDTDADTSASDRRLDKKHWRKSERFVEWWESYRAVCQGRPTGSGDVQEAFSRWKRLTDAERDKAEGSVPVYADYLAAEDRQRKPGQPHPSMHGSTFLGGKFDGIDQRLADAIAAAPSTRAAAGPRPTCDHCGQYRDAHRDAYCDRTAA